MTGKPVRVGSRAGGCFRGLPATWRVRNPLPSQPYGFHFGFGLALTSRGHDMEWIIVLPRQRFLKAAGGSPAPYRLQSRAPQRRGQAQEDLSAVALDRSPWATVLKVLLRHHNWAHAIKGKVVSYKTMEERERFLFAFFRELRTNADKRYRIDPRGLGNRHIQFMVDRWLQRDLSPATIQQYLSFLRTFSGWIGKPHLVMDPSDYIGDSGRYARSYTATEDKSWASHGVEVESMFEAMSRIDRFAAAQLAVKAAFGLRRKEAIMLQPHAQVVMAEAAGIADPDCDCYLVLFKGTKGGRRRVLPVDSERKRLALARAMDVARGPNDHLGHPGRTLKQNLRRIDYVMAKLGLTHQALGVTGHGLRHEFANDLYEAEAGSTSPLRGGEVVEPALDRPARLKVAEALGHGRLQISGAYLGGLKNRTPGADSDRDPCGGRS